MRVDAGPQARASGAGTRLPQSAAWCSPPARTGPCSRAAGRAVERYLRAAERVLRGPAVVVLTVAAFAAAGAAGGSAGIAIASAWMTILGTYCLANFWHCRETHCAVTGPGWTLAAALGFATALVPGAGLSWYQVNAEAAVFMVILAAGYALEHLVAARTGRRVLRREGKHAQDR